MLLQIEKIDIITAGMGNALATDGGFCTGSVRVVDHQVGLQFIDIIYCTAEQIYFDIGFKILLHVTVTCFQLTTS